jgi:hypothetical protein
VQDILYAIGWGNSDSPAKRVPRRSYKSSV